MTMSPVCICALAQSCYRDRNAISQPRPSDAFSEGNKLGAGSLRLSDRREKLLGGIRLQDEAQFEGANNIVGFVFQRVRSMDTCRG